MYPGPWAESHPDKPALIMAGSGETVSFGELNDRSIRVARLLQEAGLQVGDHVSLFAENHPRYFEVIWACLRSGLYVTAVNRYLTDEEAAYIVTDSTSRALIVSAGLGETAAGILDHAPGVEVRLAFGGHVDGYDAYEDAIAAVSGDPLDAEPLGEMMLYSSGTTGRPKGIKRPLSGSHVGDGIGIVALLAGLFQFDAETVYLSPAPIYHSAPLAYSLGAQGLGGTVVMLEKFDAVGALDAIERHGVTHSQWVPTMFSRMLKLPDDQRTGRDLSSHRVAIHAAAPCPVDVKRQMIDWWGPIIHEYYAGTEANGLTYLDSEAWLAHPGSVGQALLGTIRICDDEGNELPTGATGLVYFERDEMPFSYHNDTDKTASVQHPTQPTWTALGDVGHVDEEGFLYLTDRATFMIISGGVNIYPQEIEDALIVHPKVVDVAVIGVPDQEMGEAVKAVVQLADGVDGGDETERELLAYCREHIAHYKCPRSIDFRDELPRLPTGKLYKRLLKDEYWGKEGSRIV
ncbi:MAG: AMP-binding protein [Actinomycetota bacterium]